MRENRLNPFETLMLQCFIEQSPEAVFHQCFSVFFQTDQYVRECPKRKSPAKGKSSAAKGGKTTGGQGKSSASAGNSGGSSGSSPGGSAGAGSPGGTPPGGGGGGGKKTPPSDVSETPGKPLKNN